MVGACPSQSLGSRFPLQACLPDRQVRTRRSSSLAGFTLQSLTRLNFAQHLPLGQEWLLYFVHVPIENSALEFQEVWSSGV